MADVIQVIIPPPNPIQIDIPVGVPGPPGAGQYQPPIELPITPGQTVWTIPSGITSDKIQVFWSGVKQRNGIDWTLSGTTFTWIGGKLEPFHSLEIISL